MIQNKYDSKAKPKSFKTASASIRSTIASKKGSYLSASVIFAFSILATTAQADTTASEDYRSPAAVDASAPIAALSKLTSLADDKPLKVTVPTIQQFKTKSGVPVMFVQTTTLPIVDVDLRHLAYISVSWLWYDIIHVCSQACLL